MTTELTFDEITTSDIDAVIDIWTRAGLTRPWNDPHRDITFAMEGPRSTVLAGRLDGQIISTVMVGHDGHRGAVYYLGVEPNAQGHGHGRATMRAAEDWLRQKGVWKLNLIVRGENKKTIGFYEAIGYEIEPNVQMTRRLEDE